MDLTGEQIMVKSVASKSVNVELFARGAFGNHLRTWKTIADLEASGFTGKIMLRFRKPDGPVQKDLTVRQAVTAARKLVRSGKWRYEEIYFNEVLERQDELVAIQGELMISDTGLYLFYSSVPMRMREALRSGNVQHVWNLQAQSLLRHHLDPSSYDDLMELLDDYPDHIIEFTCCKQAVGSMADRGRNTIVWEVRQY
jgi:hypothetical protein